MNENEDNIKCMVSYRSWIPTCVCQKSEFIESFKELFSGFQKKIWGINRKIALNKINNFHGDTI